MTTPVPTGAPGPGDDLSRLGSGLSTADRISIRLLHRGVLAEVGF